MFWHIITKSYFVISLLYGIIYCYYVFVEIIFCFMVVWQNYILFRFIFSICLCLPIGMDQDFPFVL